jgi:hypothetical protein
MQLVPMGLRHNILSLSGGVRAWWEDTRDQGWLETDFCRQQVMSPEAMVLASE